MFCSFRLLIISGLESEEIDEISLQKNFISHKILLKMKRMARKPERLDRLLFHNVNR